MSTAAARLPIPRVPAPSPLSSAGALALRRLARMSGWWSLSRTELASLIGRPERALPLRLRGANAVLTAMVDRLEDVHAASRAAGFGPDWLRHGSNILDGRSPLAVMAEGDVETVLRSLQH